MPKSFVKFSRRIFIQKWILDPAIDSTQRGGPNAHLIDQKRPEKHRQNYFLKKLVQIEKLGF